MAIPLRYIATGEGHVGLTIMADITEIIALHRYFIWANKMRTDFDGLLVEQSQSKTDQERLQTETFLYMSYWYAGLFVVIEGWNELKLSDPVINSMLKSPNVSLLKRYRNGVFHFQKKYSDMRFLEFMSEGKNSVEWIRTLNQEFGRWFLNWCKTNST